MSICRASLSTLFAVLAGSLFQPIDALAQSGAGSIQILSTLDENMSKVWGKHQMAFGGRYRHERFGYLPDRNADTIRGVSVVCELLAKLHQCVAGAGRHRVSPDVLLDTAPGSVLGPFVVLIVGQTLSSVNMPLAANTLYFNKDMETTHVAGSPFPHA
jgi:hypothetical protein